MKPLDCCKDCEGFNKENGIFRNKLKCFFCDTYSLESIKLRYNELKKKKGCSTCKYCERAHDYPSFTTGEECICKAGLECDTVCFTVKDCPKWIGVFEDDNS
jgi:hypothetical protein